jgi:hypothetical protein
MPVKKPQSRFEKFSEGLRIIMIHQPAAEMSISGKFFCLGDTEDPHVSRGAKDYLKGLGFSIREGKFCYQVDEEN